MGHVRSNARERIASEVLLWPEVTEVPHRFGGVEFRFKGREIGHLHGDSLCDIPLPRAIRDEVVESGKAMPHHIFPESSWVSVYLQTNEDIANAIEIMRRRYDRIVEREAGE